MGRPGVGVEIAEVGLRRAGVKRQVETGYLPSCPVCMNVWTADGKHRVR